MRNLKEDGIWLFLDNEGPQTKNDNAQENTVALARECGLREEVGAAFYRGLSNVDDIYGDFRMVFHIDPTYSSGHTLKVVLPFYKAMGATSEWLVDFARESLLVVPNIAQVLQSLDRKYNVWQISTSYNFFIRAFCEAVGFDFNRARCTKVEKFDAIPIMDQEKYLLLSFMKEVAEMPVIKYDSQTGKVLPEHQKYYDRFTSFIWETVYNMPVGELLRIVHPVGQAQKREAVKEICEQNNVRKDRVMYVGDSQTDVQCVEWLQGVGLTLMFNGKGKVCGLSDLMYIGSDARAIEEVADLFAQVGRQGVIDYYTRLRKAKCGGLLSAVTKDNIGVLESRSVAHRKKFRGVHIGELT